MIYYSVGALLYCPANKKTIADSVIHEKFGTKYSLALCLEDTINDNYVTEAEQDLISSIHQIFESFQDHPFYLPKIFIRVRNAGQIERLTKAFGESIKVITGYIIPKFTADNASSYIEEMIRANEQASRKLYMMPIYESSSIIDLRHRIDILYDLNLRFCFIIQNKSIIQNDSIVGEHNGHNLVPIILYSFQMRLMEIHSLNWMQSL